MVKWPFKNRRSQRHDQASPAHSGGAYSYQDAAGGYESQYPSDYVWAPYPGWPGPPYPGAQTSPATFQATPMGYSAYAASPTVHTPSTITGLPYPVQGAYVDSQKWRDTSVPAPENAPYLEYTGPDKPTPEDLRRALFIARFSPPPSHWRALIPLDPVPNADGLYAPPIKRLPVELLSYIFTRSMDGEVDSLFHAYFAGCSTPLVIASVCRLWRHIALDLPFLWQRFAMRPCQGRGHYRIARLYMERSKGLGIYVHYAEDSRRGAYPREVCPCALDLIIQNIGQVKALDLLEVSPSTLARLSRVPIGAASSMVQFSITTREKNTSWEVARALSSLYLTTTIREIQWGLRTFPEEIHWSCITSFRLWACKIDPFTLLRILVSAPGLRLIDVKLSSTSSGDGTSIPFGAVVHHRAMGNLLIECDGPLDALMQALDLPHLRRLRLRRRSPSLKEYPSNGWPFANLEVFHAFLGRLRDGLEYFMLIPGGAGFDETALLRVISMPQMERLKMLDVSDLGGGVSSAIFAKLTPRRTDHTPLLPHIEHLGLCDCIAVDGAISRMLEGRHKYGYPLRYVSLRYPYGDQTAHRTDLATIESLRKVGWQIIWGAC
ncbi:uncharacterized protein SCHCODRAFT_02616413 [Schizophyllum commune H4-8]|nr:uncharacterized protein SCHCODRAFT_02616413 [Schizophyllum commune H4-8]KAI5896997.1 hypothetical protein SCHCODRAFT_02616413 [Schizophyllum commune H4-8]